MTRPPGRSAGLACFWCANRPTSWSIITISPLAGMSWWRPSARQPPMFELMRGLPLFKGFPDLDLQHLADGMANRYLPAGEVLFWQGEAGHECYVILAGELEVIVHPGRSEVRLEVRQVGQIIGEMALIDPSPRSATVRALTASHVAVLGEHAFTALMHRNPELMFNMLRNNTARLRRT